MEHVERLPKFECHKVVEAAKISIVMESALSLRHDVAGRGTRGVAVPVTAEWMQRHKPEVGGYFVQYPDGYQSYSPAKSFEDGYTLLDEERL